MTERFDCAVCGGHRLEEVRTFERLPRITSDCKPFAPGGRLVECLECGATQKVPSARWLEEIGRIYDAYVPYHQAEGVEQIVLDSETGTLRRRSEVIVSRLRARAVLPPAGSALDVGCGSGATLKVLSREFPRWRLFGLELDHRNHAHLSAIPNLERVYAGSHAEIDHAFDLVTSIHSLEHFPSPSNVLHSLRAKVADRGHLFLQLPNTAENPFDLVVADHLLHFSPRTAVRIAERAGFHVESVATAWVPKEISLLAQPGAHPRGALRGAQHDEFGVGRAGVDWLFSVIEDAAACARQSRSFGIFGTSISATWLAGSLPGKVSFFVDEDAQRQNRDYMGRPVVSPDRIPAGSTVFLALAPLVQANVRRRLAPLAINFAGPRPVPGSLRPD